MPESDVLRLRDVGVDTLSHLLLPFGLGVEEVPAATAIPGSHWGDDEAGLIRNTLFVRSDTPVHSALHEACHWLLMDEARRRILHTDAGGTAAEEDAVCYLQILLADKVHGFGRQRCLADMDAWGYSFRLGSACAWFKSDAEDAQATLVAHGVLSDGATEILPHANGVARLHVRSPSNTAFEQYNNS